MNPGAARPLRAAQDRWHLGKSIALSVLMHAFAAAFIVLAAWWFDWTALKDLLVQHRSLPASGPAPAQSVTMELLHQTPQPPTPSTPLPPQPIAPNPTIVQKLPKPVVPPTPIPKVVQQLAKPAHAHAPTATAKTLAQTRPKPKTPYTAAHATGAGQTPQISPARLGSKGLPVPGYPLDALYRGEGGTVNMQVSFGADGEVQSARVKQSSGYAILDTSTLAFIYAHWKNASLANSTIHIPIIYDPGKTVTSAGP